ncbi:MAG: hypothetical protein ACK4UN_22500, partial [Limisphaerales bacterium]
MNPTQTLPESVSSASISELILCPVCSNRLIQKNDKVVCCQDHSYPIIDGIPVIAKNSGYHFLSPSKEQMEQAFAVMDKQGFWKGMDYLTKDLDDEGTRDLMHYMLNETRAAW